MYKLDGAGGPDWGDYSDILVNGMSCHLERSNGRIQLERTGPFVPPITFPGIGDIVFTDFLKREYETSGLTGLEFRSVDKAHIVRLEWELWDREADEPQEYPDGGEPEGYLLDQPHSPEVSGLLGDLWEACPKQTTSVESGTDWFRINHHNFVSEKAKTWLERMAGEWVAFESV